MNTICLVFRGNKNLSSVSGSSISGGKKVKYIFICIIIFCLVWNDLGEGVVSLFVSKLPLSCFFKRSYKKHKTKCHILMWHLGHKWWLSCWHLKLLLLQEPYHKNYTRVVIPYTVITSTNT